MERGPIPLKMHALAEPLMALVLIAAPWIFGFSDVQEATVISVAAGVLMLATGGMTRWRWSLAKLIPLRMHFMADVGPATVLILSPFVIGFSDEGGATRFLVIVGLLELITALGTRWDEREAEISKTRGGRSRTATA